jgi:hypothetical protein
MRSETWLIKGIICEFPFFAPDGVELTLLS